MDKPMLIEGINLAEGNRNAERKRQRFKAAIAAMQGILANATVTRLMSDDQSLKLTVANAAVFYADALLAALESTAAKEPK